MARRGAYVAELPEQDIRDDFELLSLAAVLVVRRAVTLLSDEQLDQLEELNRQAAASTDETLLEGSQMVLEQMIISAGLSHSLKTELLHMRRAMPNWAPGRAADVGFCRACSNALSKRFARGTRTRSPV